MQKERIVFLLEHNKPIQETIFEKVYLSAQIQQKLFAL